MARKNKESQCVEIARDALAQLESGRYRISPIYLDSTEIRCAVGSVQRAIKATKVCQVCAVGALFVSTVRLYNDMENNGSYMRFPQIREKLLEFFTPEEVESIEATFETFGPQERYGSRWRNTPKTERLRIILTTIIQNNGKFSKQRALKWKS